MTFYRTLAVAGIAASLVVAQAHGSHAFHTGPYDSAELKCRSTIAKTFTKAISTGQKTIAGCHKTRDKSGGAADCNVLDLANADAKGKFAKAQNKLTAGIQKACIDSGIDGYVLEQYVSCPEPCSTDLGLANPLTSYAELGQCLACVASEIAEDFGAATMGLPGSVPLSSDDAKCHGAIGKFYGKYLSTILKDRTKCQNSAEKGGATHLDETTCLTADEKGKIAKALTKATGGLDKLCPAANLTNLDSCADTSLADLKTCLQTEGDTSGDDGVTYTYGMPPTVCPIGFDALVRGRNAFNGNEKTTTQLELGWTGIAHLSDLQDNYNISVDITCPNGAPPCGSCSIDGVSAAGPQYTAFSRCTNNYTIECDEPFSNDVDDCGGNFCAYILGPPLPVSAGNNPVCSINRLISDFTGTTDPDVGAGELSLELSTLVHLGVGLATPCPVCLGDTTALDGVKNGTCSGGANNGGACDVQGFSKSFAGTPPADGLSLDCPPGQLDNISGSGLYIPLDLTTGASSLAFENSCDAPLGFLDCACGQCSGDTALPCRNDGECAAAGAGLCTSIGAGVARVPNDCGDGVCTDLGNGKGTCEAGPTDTFCDGLLDADGEGFIGCTNNTDCAAVGSNCPGNDCGTCTETRQRSCFLDPIVAQGTPDTENPITVSTFCLPPTNNAAINGTSGSPGPVRVTVDQLTTLRY